MTFISQINLKPMAQRQGGSVLILAIFVLVVMAMLMMVLSRLIADSDRSVSWEVLGTRANLAAESALDSGLYDLLTGIDSGVLTGSCPSSSDDSRWSSADSSGATTRSFVFSPDGLTGCSTALTCVAPFYMDELEQYFYQFNAVASCGSGEIAVEREVTIQAKSSL